MAVLGVRKLAGSGRLLPIVSWRSAGASRQMWGEGDRGIHTDAAELARGKDRRMGCGQGGQGGRVEVEGNG